MVFDPSLVSIVRLRSAHVRTSFARLEEKVR